LRLDETLRGEIKVWKDLVPARRQRAHAPPESVICSIIVFTGTVRLPSQP
jgi:hypothetical protein